MATLQGGEYHDGGPNGQGHYDNGNHNGLDNGNGQGNASAAHDSLFGSASHDAVAASDSVNVGTAHQSSSDIVSSAQNDQGASASADTSSAGHDTSGHDTFVFTGGGGHDVVMDFQQGQDLLHIAANVNGLNISSPADLAAHVSNVQGNAVLDLGHGDTITLHGVTADEVHHNPGAFFTVS